MNLNIVEDTSFEYLLVEFKWGRSEGKGGWILIPNLPSIVVVDLLPLSVALRHCFFRRALNCMAEEN